MKFIKHLYWFVPLLLILVASCRKEVFDTVPEEGSVDCGQIDYERDIKPIFEANCISCHAAGGSAPGDFTQLENIQAQADEIKTKAVIEGTMPPNGAMSIEDKKLLGDWIDCGAKGAGVSYATDVSPILDSNCVVCHTTGGSAPGDFSKYADVKNAIDNKNLENRVFVAQDMPQGGSLTAEERQILYNWIKGGSPNN